ncbi:MAG: fused MFS/spermidine synthase [Novosphingobium sp.]|nr:fused MFS/spermidine synthase [Novosphingobium sp.]
MNRVGPVMRPLFVATILVGSYLLFLVQPMVARMALPRLGGAPNVWNSAMLVYQSLLLAGYAYAHWLSKAEPRRQAVVHLALLAACALTLPIALAAPAGFAAGWEVLWVPLLLLLTIGPVFFAMSAQAPLMQRWYSLHPQAGEPWALYAASNLGSFAGLMAYPLIAEPLLSLDGQSMAWSAGYLLLIALVVACALARRQQAVTQADTVAAAEDAGSPGWRRIALWIALSAVPSGLMLSTTTHVTTDIFAMPLLWVIPLGLYLLSFVIAFSDRRDLAWAIGLFAPVVMLACGGLSMISHGAGGSLIAIASLALLFSVATTLHSRLYEVKPHAAHLTAFYLAMSAGGALGGLFTALIAPVVFDWVWEHPLLILAAAILMPLPSLLNWHRMDALDPQMARVAAVVFVAVALCLAWLLYTVVSEREPFIHRVFLTAMLCGMGLLLTGWRVLFLGVLVAMMLAQGGADTIETTLKGERSRSYFGVYTVRDYPDAKLRQLVHGTTLHGQQSTDPAHAREPSTYYGRQSGAGLTLASAPALFGNGARVGVVGLGTGTLACYHQPGQHWTVFEIDPKVVRYSRDGTFTYLSRCAPGARIVLGDARIELTKVAPGSFDVLAVDAFSSDAIPLHLITREAVEVYLRSISRDGVVLLHVSNRFVELEPIVAAIARDLGLSAIERMDNPPAENGLTPSSWIALSPRPETLEELAKASPDAPWEALAPPAERAWTDDRASILPYIRWNQLLGTP